MRNYELILILNPELTSDEQKVLLDDIKDELKSGKAKIVSEDDWWVRDLAYKIKWSKKGHYLLLKLESEWNKFFDITKSFNIKKDIWRHMFTKIED